MKLVDLLYKYLRLFVLQPKKRKIWVSSRQIGKSFTIAFILVYKALSKSNGLSLCVSVNSRSASEILKKCALFAEAVKKMTNGSITYSASFDCIHFSNGSRIMSLPSTSDSLRGFTALCVCIDEAAFVWKLDEILQGIGPTLTRDKDAELILTTTPAGMNGPFYDLYTKALDDLDWHVLTTTIHDAIADGLEVDVSSLKSLCPDPEVFSQEYECKFLSEYGSMIDVNAIDWYDEMPPGKPSVYLGYDVGSTSDRSSIVDAKLLDGVAYIDDISLLFKTSYEEQLKILSLKNLQCQYRAGYIDKTGIGSAFAEFATKNVSYKIKGLQFTGSNKTPMFERLRSGIFEHKVKFNRKLKKLVEDDFRNVLRVVTASGDVKYIAGHDGNGHSDATSGIILALKAIDDNPPSVSMPMPYCFTTRI